MMQREKKETSNSFLMFMEDKVNFVLGLIVEEQLGELEYLIDQLFFDICQK